MRSPATQQADIDVAGELSAFRSRWSKQRQWGLKQDLSLPPLDAQQHTEARAAAHTFYWSGNPVVYGDHKRLLRDTVNAVEAAHAAHEACRQRGKLRGKSALRLRLRARDGDDCWVCGQELGDDATIEHKEPLARGGTWAFGNLALAHKHCNQSLGALPEVAKEAARKAIRNEQEQS